MLDIRDHGGAFGGGGGVDLIKNTLGLKASKTTNTFDNLARGIAILGNEVFVLHTAGSTFTVRVYDFNLVELRWFTFTVTLAPSFRDFRVDEQTGNLYFQVLNTTMKKVYVYCYDTNGDQKWVHEKPYADYVFRLNFHGNKLGVAVKQGVDFIDKTTGALLSTVNLELTNNNSDGTMAFDDNHIVVTPYTRQFNSNRHSGVPAQVGSVQVGYNSGYTQFTGVELRNNKAYASLRDGYDNSGHFLAIDVVAPLINADRSQLYAANNLNFQRWSFKRKGIIYWWMGDYFNAAIGDGTAIAAYQFHRSSFADNVQNIYWLDTDSKRIVALTTTNKIVLTELKTIKITD